MVFLEIPNVLLGTVFAETVTYMSIIKAHYITLLIVTAISILTGPNNTLTVLLEYIKHFDLNHTGNIKKIIITEEEMLIHCLTLPHIKA